MATLRVRPILFGGHAAPIAAVGVLELEGGRAGLRHGCWTWPLGKPLEAVTAADVQRLYPPTVPPITLLEPRDVPVEAVLGPDPRGRAEASGMGRGPRKPNLQLRDPPPLEVRFQGAPATA